MRFLSDEYLGALRVANQRAAALGLRLDLTLGSGWPFGGPTVGVTDAASRLRLDRIVVGPGAPRVARPAMTTGETWIGAFVGPDADTRVTPASMRPLAWPDAADAVTLPAAPHSRQVWFFIAGRTGMQVKRPAVGGEGYVLSHYDRGALDRYLDAGGRAAAEPVCRPSSVRDLLRQPRGLRLGLVGRLRIGVFVASGLRRRAAAAGAGGRSWRGGRHGARGLGPHAHRAAGRAVHHPARRVGPRTRHAVADSGLRDPAGHRVEQCRRGSAGRRGAPVARAHRVAVGLVGQPPVRQARGEQRDVDLAALAVVSGDAARPQGRSRSPLPAGHHAAYRPRVAVHSGGRGLSGLAVLRRRRLQRSQSVVAGDAGCVGATCSA